MSRDSAKVEVALEAIGMKETRLGPDVELRDLVCSDGNLWFVVFDGAFREPAFFTREEAQAHLETLKAARSIG